MNKENSLILRAAHRSEARQIASMSRLHIEYGLRWRWTPAKIREYIKDPETMVLVASDEGVLAGFAVMKFHDEEAHLLLLAVEPMSRRSGIGRALVTWLEKSCRTAGLRIIRLEVRASNDSAKAFYDNLGYRFVGQVAAYYDSREAAVVMTRSLSEQEG